MALLSDAQGTGLLDMIEPESRDFMFQRWEKALDNVKCFRVVGLDYVLDFHGIAHARIFGNVDLQKRALRAIPTSWTEVYPTKDRGWRSFKRDQFSHAYYNRAVRLDKAVIAILIGCAALDENGVSFDKYFNYVKIRPQLYFVDGYTTEFYNNFIRGSSLTRELLENTSLSSTEQLMLIAHGHCVTKKTAQRIVDVLEPRFKIIQGVAHMRKAPRILVDEFIEYDPEEYGEPVLRRSASA